MIILTNCLTKTTDEGALKVANSLIKQLKEQRSNVKVVSYERKTECSDIHLSLNKLMINPELLRYLRHTDEEVIYIPFPAGMIPIFARVFILSLFARKRLKIILMMQDRINLVGKFLLGISSAETFSLSKESWSKCEGIIGRKAKYLKAGVNTEKYIPVPEWKKAELKRKYGVPEDSVVVLHVGHMKEGRNIQKLLNLDEKYFVLIVISTFMENEQDTMLRRTLEERKNIKIIDSFLENIEEIYQLSDVYFFPVENTSNCIDAPLSVFEAASCNVPVVHTAYKALDEFEGKEGFYRIESFEPDSLNRLISEAISQKQKPRNSILEYDWNQAIDTLCSKSGRKPA